MYGFQSCSEVEKKGSRFMKRKKNLFFKKQKFEEL
jgi:hypothetical protein